MACSNLFSLSRKGKMCHRETETNARVVLQNLMEKMTTMTNNIKTDREIICVVFRLQRLYILYYSKYAHSTFHIRHRTLLLYCWDSPQMNICTVHISHLRSNRCPVTIELGVCLDVVWVYCERLRVQVIRCLKVSLFKHLVPLLLLGFQCFGILQKWSSDYSVELDDKTNQKKTP